MAAVDFTAVKLLKPQLDDLADRGFRVRLACQLSSEDAAQELSRFTPVQVSFPRSPKPAAMAAALLSLVRSVHADPPALLHLHTPAAALAARSLPRRLWPADLCIVYSVHGFLHAWPPTGVRDKLVQRIEQRQATRTDALLFQSDEDLREATARGYCTKLRRLGNGVEDSWFELAAPPRRQGPLELLYVGRLVREKGVLELVRAVASVPDVKLTMVGSALPSDRDGVDLEIRSLVDELRCGNRVRFLGMLPRAEVVSAMARSHAFVLPSHREGMPRSVIEAMASARPCVVTDIRGSRELVRHGREGLVVPAGDPQALAAAVRALAGMTHEQFGDMAVRARRRADQEFRERAVFDRLAALYDELGVRP